MIRQLNKYGIALIYIAILLLWFANARNPFFWDTIQLGSKHANWFYQNSFSRFWLPNEMDSGHFPIFGMYLALCWMIFGKTLLVSHLAMLPFVLATVFFLQKFIGKTIDRDKRFWALLLVVADPTLLAQFTLISPDVVLMAFFCAGLYAHYTSRRGWFAVSLVLLSLISMRGMILVAAWGLFDLVWNYRENHKFYRNYSRLWSIIHNYLPAVIIIIGFQFAHWHALGWFAWHSNSPWSESFQVVSPYTLLRNLFIYGWRIADFGRLGLWLAGVAIFVYFWIHGFSQTKAAKYIFTWLVCTILIFAVPVSLFSGLSGHRYLLPVFVAGALWFVLQWQQLRIRRAYRNAIFATVLVVLFSGNFWVYPDKISQGWDANLAHTPWFALRDSAIGYLDDNQIPLSAVGSDFPDLATANHTHLNGDNRSFSLKDFGQNKWILQSNIHNNFSDAELDTLRQQWILQKEWTQRKIYYRLYTHP